jgi:hypothetical protein
VFPSPLHPLQGLHSELRSLEACHAGLVALASSLGSSAPQQRAQLLTEDLETLHTRWSAQNTAVPQRYGPPGEDLPQGAGAEVLTSWGRGTDSQGQGF